MSQDLVRSASLWAVQENIQAWMDTLDRLDPQSPDYATVTAELNAAIQAEIKKVSGIVAYRAHCLAMAARADMMQQQFLNARIEWQRTEERLESYVKSVMQSWGKKELEGDGLKIKLKANPPSVVITDEALIPGAYMVTPPPKPPPPPSPSKALIAKALKAGIDVPGADLAFGERVDWGDPPKSKAGAVEGEIV